MVPIRPPTTTEGMRPIPPKGFSIAIPMAPKKGWADWGTEHADRFC